MVVIATMERSPTPATAAWRSPLRIKLRRTEVEEVTVVAPLQSYTVFYITRVRYYSITFREALTLKGVGSSTTQRDDRVYNEVSWGVQVDGRVSCFRGEVSEWADREHSKLRDKVQASEFLKYEVGSLSLDYERLLPSGLRNAQKDKNLFKVALCLLYLYIDM